MAQVSVIVPVYKVEAYLDRCVRSILGQSFRDFQLILVDDGSPDNCGALCDEYAREDCRVRVIHQTNGGLSAARNAGIDLSLTTDAQWLTFIDSDDWVHPRFLESLLQAAEGCHTKLSLCDYGQTDGEDPWAEGEGGWESRSPAAFYQEQFVCATIACTKLYHRSLFSSIRFPVGKLHEDEFVTYRLLFAQKEIAFIPAPMYAYYRNESGITKAKWSPRRLDAWEAYDQQIAFFRERGEENLVKFRLREYIESGKKNLCAAMEAKDTGKRVIRAMKKKLRRVIRQAWKAGCVEFWMDYDFLYTVSPFMTRAYRFWLDKIRRGKNA